MPANRVTFGEKGLKWVKWMGEVRDFRGAVTGCLYAFPEHHRTKGVDLRDLPGLVKDGGRENWEDIRGKKFDVPEPEEKPVPKPPQEKPKVEKPPAKPAPVSKEVAVDG